jgi:RNA polymerase sigma factor (sigma-70 family)
MASMASVVIGGSLRHLCDLFKDGTAVGLGDSQLLARYAASSDDAAFAALVARHGPMVIATCRAVLDHEQDVEDAFQATFLLLARKARSVRAGDALGGWLHRVAYRAAVQAGAELRRRRREVEVATMASLRRARPGPDIEVASIIHEEVDRLPDHQRLAVVLCDLEGLTYEQAAYRLRWTEPTLRHRLVKARRRLRERLTRRGVTAGSLGAFLAASAAGARAAVAAATGGAASISAAALATQLISGLLVSRMKIAAAASLTLVSLGVIAAGLWRPGPPPPSAVSAQALPARAGADMKRTPATGDAAPPASAPGAFVEVRGRVVDPQGRPVTGATVRTAWLRPEDTPVPDVPSGPDGRFVARILRSSLGAGDMVNRGDYTPRLAAMAPGFGPGWAPDVLRADALGEVTIKLVEDGPPIDGRILDLEGRPVAGARVEVRRLWFARDELSWSVETGDLTAWLRRAQDLGLNEGPWDGLSALPMANTTATTDRDGRFRLTGIGRERIAELMISGPTIATAQIYAQCHDGPEVRCKELQGRPGEQAIVFHARRFGYSAAPTQPIEGVIRDKDTGRPIAGVLLRGSVYIGRRSIWAEGVEATSDAQGRYRLTGLNKGSAYGLFVNPKEGQPYPRAALRVPADSPALEPVTFDIALKRAILVRGRVTDRSTGRPVWGRVSAYSFRDDPHVRDYPGFEGSNMQYIPIKEDGRFEVVALPGRGIITCFSDQRRYRLGVGAEAIQRSRYFDTLPISTYREQYHVFAAVDLDPKVESATVDLQVDPGRSLTIQVIDPEGKPLIPTRVKGAGHGPQREGKWETPAVEIRALDPSEPRRVTIIHDGRKLVASVYLRGDEAGPLSLRLQPWGTITGRIVDDDGQPRDGVWIGSPHGDDQQRGKLGDLRTDDGRSPIRTGRDGRFRVEGLVPGVKYGAFTLEMPNRKILGDIFRDLTVAPGEIKNLGDLKPVATGRSD